MVYNKIKEIIINFWERDNFLYFKRNFRIPELNSKKVISLIWPRRSWKTSICFLKIKELLDRWLDKKNILYINFEDERLIDFTVSDFDKLLKSYFELSEKSINDKDIYFFFDEIQNVSWWEKFIVRVLNNFNINIVVTGSSAKMLSKEVDTALRWKNISFEVLPLNFQEFLNFKQVKLPKNFQYSIDWYNLYKKLLKEFTIWWWFPEIVLEDNLEIKKWILKNYYDLIFYKDVVERYSIRDIANLKKFRKILTSEFWNLISLKKISEKLNVSYQIISNWFEYFQDSYFWFSLKKFSFSALSVEKSMSKFYISDNGLFSTNFLDLNEKNLSRLFENMVFLELRKQWFIENEKIFYYKDNSFDIDFILFKNWKIIPVQVCYDLNEDNRKREFEQLEHFVEKFNLEKWTLVVFENNLEIESKKVEVIWLTECIDLLKK